MRFSLALLAIFLTLPALAGNGGITGAGKIGGGGISLVGKNGSSGIIGMGRTGDGGVIGAGKPVQLQIPSFNETLVADGMLIPVTVSTSILPLEAGAFAEVRAALQEADNVNFGAEAGQLSYQVTNYGEKTITLSTEPKNEIIIMNAE